MEMERRTIECDVERGCREVAESGWRGGKEGNGKCYHMSLFPFRFRHFHSFSAQLFFSFLHPTHFFPLSFFSFILPPISSFSSFFLFFHQSSHSIFSYFLLITFPSPRSRFIIATRRPCFPFLSFIILLTSLLHFSFS